jgi:hypothetical protein
MFYNIKTCSSYMAKPIRQSPLFVKKAECPIPHPTPPPPLQSLAVRRHDIQYNDIQLNDSQHCDARHNGLI